MKRLLHFTTANRAFTLIELIMAMAGCAIILAAVYGVFTRAIHLRNDTTARTREARVRSHALSVIRNDLRQAWISGGTMAAVLEGSTTSPHGSFPGYLKFIATTARDEGANPSSELQQVEYYVVTDTAAADRKSGMLVRAVDRRLLAPVRETPAEEPLLRGVESMEVSFFDGDAWQESWTYAEALDPVPEAVRVRIQTSTDAVPFETLVLWTARPKS